MGVYAFGTNVVVLKGKPSNCMDCPFHEVIPDPDLSDSFNYDDKAVICTRSMDEKCNPNSKWVADRHPNRKVSCSVRPYNLRKESDTPEWCPLPGATK